ncbi:hypothetical protein ACLD9W_10835 [Neisseria sp. WLZKY-1]|uniref:hypothetical protein n=1 Tax=Neisseria sp. WLZKY-1 TaxID=3390377 RepID=UPI00397931DA
MKKTLLAALLSAAAALSCAADNSRIGRLEAEIAAMKQRIAELEQQVGISARPAAPAGEQTNGSAPPRLVAPTAADFSNGKAQLVNVVYECGIYVNGQRYEARNRVKAAAMAAAKQSCREEESNALSCSESNILCTEWK